MQTAKPTAARPELTVDDLRATTFELEAQLRVATNECDFLRGRLDVYERREAEQAATRLTDPKDLWVAGIELDDLRGLDGTIDADKVAEAAARVIAEHPGWAKRRAALPDRRQGEANANTPADQSKSAV